MYLKRIYFNNDQLIWNKFKFYFHVFFIKNKRFVENFTIK